MNANNQPSEHQQQPQQTDNNNRTIIQIDMDHNNYHQVSSSSGAPSTSPSSSSFMRRLLTRTGLVSNQQVPNRVHHTVPVPPLASFNQIPSNSGGSLFAHHHYFPPAANAAQGPAAITTTTLMGGGQHSPSSPSPSITRASGFDPLHRSPSIQSIPDMVRDMVYGGSAAVADHGNNGHNANAPGGGGGGNHTPGTGEDDNQRNAGAFSDAMAQHPELRSFVVAVLKTLPFVGIVLLKVAFDHLNSLLNLAFLCGIFLHTNVHLKKEITKKGEKNAKKLYFHLAIIAFGLLIKFGDDPYILDIISLLSYKTVSKLGELLYYLLMADLCMKCVTVAAKTIITLLPERVVELKGRGRIFLFVEACSQFYRCFLPVQPWAAYLLNSYEGYDRIFGSLLVVAFVFWKFREVLVAGKFLRESYTKFKQNSNFGSTPTVEELNAVGNCPICHETFSSPIALECSHIFCDSCIGVWFDRETTCPLCRKQIADDVRFRDGSTSLFVQVF